MMGGHISMLTGTSKRLISAFLSILLLLTLFPVSAFAATEVASGYCGGDRSTELDITSKCFTNLTWTLYDNGELVISGKGQMNRFTVYPPWFYSFRDEITSITIGEGVTNISANAFAQHGNLTSVTIPNSVESIENYAFRECSSLVDVTIPNSVTSIGYSSFEFCSSLTSVTIPDSVASIGGGAFSFCDSLTTISVEINNQYYSSDDYGVLFNKNKTELIRYPQGNMRIHYSIPDSVESIEYQAFIECHNLVSVTIPDRVEIIGDDAFSRCDALSNITIPKSVEVIKSGAFSNCNSLTSVTIQDGVKIIESSAFFECNSLIGVTIPNSIESIGSYAFCFCSRLENVTIGNGITSIGKMAFRECPILKDVYYSGDESQWKNISIVKKWDEASFDYPTIHFSCNGGLHPTQSFTLDSTSDIRRAVYEYETFEPLSNADISYNGKHLEISLDGYETVNIPSCTIDSRRYGTFALVPASLNSHISAVHCNGRDAFVNEVKILSTAKSFDVYVYGSGAKYQLFSDHPSGNNKIAESTDGHFIVNTASLTKGKPLYVRAVTTSGAVGEAIKTNICVKEAFNSSTKLTNKISLTVPNDVPLLGGSDFSIDIGGLCPVSYTQEGNTIRFGLGCKESLLSKDNSSNWLNFKKAVDKMCSDWDKGSAMYGFAKSWNDNVFSPNSKFNTEFYGYCEVILADDGSVSSWGGRLAMVVKGGWEGQWQTVVVVVPVVIKFSAEASLGAGFSLGLDLDRATLYMDGEATLVLPKIRASAGVGIAYVADISVYGSGENKIKFTTSRQGQRVTGTLSGEIGVGLSALCFSGDIPILQGDWEYWNTGLFSLQSALLCADVSERAFDSTNYTLDRSYIDTQSGWYTEQPKKLMLMSSGGNGASETMVQSSVYYSADPQLVITENGTRVMVWTADIPSRSTGNHLAAVYSVYDETDGTWSAPVIVDDDGTLDANVTATAYGNKVYMAWSDAKSADFTGDTTMTEMAAALEISAAVYDTKTGNISVSRLTDNALADLRPMLSADENGVYVAWVENNNADLLQMSGTNNIRYSVLDGSAWSEPATFESTDKPIVGLDIGTLGESVHIAYTADTDGSLQTTEDVELFCGAVNFSASALTDNESMEQSPQFVDWLGKPALAWYGAESICVYDGSNTTVYAVADTGVGAEFAVENGRILSVQNSDDGSMLYSSDILDGEIGKPVAITNNADYMAAFSADSVKSTTYVAFTRRSAVIGEESITEATDLCIAEIKGFHDLTLLSAEVDETDVVAAATVPVTLTVKNNGLFDESGVLVTGTLDGVKKVSAICDTSIAKGDTAAITVQLPLESVITPKTEYVFSIAPVNAEDRSAADNEASLILGYADLQLNAELIGSGENKSALIDVENLSGIDTNAILHIYDDDEERTQLAAYDIGTIKAGTWELYEIDSSLLPQLRETSRNLYFTVEAAEEENLTGDNSAFLYLQSEPKDMTITVSVNGEETDFLCGASGMSQIAVAIYDEAGKMISLKTVGYSEDCEEVTVTFTDTAIPHDCHVKVFLLDKNWTPVTAALVVASATL